MKIGICGGTGLIGKALVKELIQKKHDVIVFTRRKDILLEFSHFIPSISEISSKHHNQANTEPLENLGTIEIVASSPPTAEELSVVDGIINLAGESILGGRWSEQQKRKLRESRVDYTRELVLSIQNANPKPKFFLSASAIGYYGMWEDESPDFSEESPSGNDFLAKLCVDWEREALEASQFCRVIIGRIGIVLTTKGGALAQMLPSFKAFVGGQIASGKQFMSWIHIQDIVRAMLLLIENSEYSGIFNLTAPNPVNNREFSKTLASVLKRPCLFQVPSFVLELLYGSGAEVVTKGQKVIPKRLMEINFSFMFPNLKEALEDLLKDQA